MTTVVLIQQGGTGANNASDAVNALGAVANTGGVITGNLNVAATLITQNVLPDANVTYDLGSNTARFKDLWLSNSTIHLGEANISSNGGNIVVSSISITQDMVVDGAIAFSGNNYGTAGQVLTSNGSGTPPLWLDAGGGLPEINIVSETTVTAIAGQHYVLTNVAQTTITLSASPSEGDVVYISARNSLSNNLIVPNGNNFESNSSNVIIDLPPYSLQLRYINSTLGWILI